MSTVKDVLRSPPLENWIKANTDDTSQDIPSYAARGGIFKDHDTTHLCSFSCKVGPGDALFAELMGAILAMEHNGNEVD